MYKKSNQPGQMNLFEDYKVPFSDFDENNRWVKLSKEIPWGAIEREYVLLFSSKRGAPATNVRVALGALLLQKKLKYTDEELVEQVKENPYLQYFLGAKEYDSQTAMFGASTLVDFRKRMVKDSDFLIKANDLIIAHATRKEEAVEEQEEDDDDTPDSGMTATGDNQLGTDMSNNQSAKVPQNKGKLVLDATCVPADITYPQDLKLLNTCRETLEAMVDEFHIKGEDKPRTYRQKARKQYLSVIKQKVKGGKKMRMAIRQQLEHVRRDISYVENYISSGRELSTRMLALFLTIQLIYSQQKEMYDKKKSRVDNRIVSLFQPHVRPIVRGKAKANVEFGAKVEISVVDGYVRMEKLSWDAYHESATLQAAVENYYVRYGYYPECVLVDQAYCTKDNRRYCLKHGIRISAKPLGRPKKSQTVDRKIVYQDSCDRNIVEGKFGEVKTTYGLERLSTRLKETSEAEIQVSLMIMNLSRLMRVKFLSLIQRFLRIALLSS